MEFSIISLGNVEFLSMILNGVAMICGTGDFLRLVSVGFLVGILFIGLQCIMEGAQRINLHQSFLCFICYLVMFGPSCTVVVEDAYTGEARVVDNLPLGVGVSGAAISGIGYGLTKMMEQGYALSDRTTERQFAEPLRILNQLRKVGYEESLFEAINAELGPRGNGSPSDSKQALINYLSECTMAKMQLGATNATKVYNATWASGEFHLQSEAHTVHLPIGGMDGGETVTCNAGYAKVNGIFQKLSSGAAKHVVNSYLHLKSDDGTVIAGSYDKIDNAMQALNATMNGAQDYVQMAVLDGVYHMAAMKFYQTQQDTASALAVNQAIMQRNSQWASEATMFLNASRAMMAFFEGFIYAITPIMGFLMAVGSFGVRLIGKYFMTLAWIQLWLPILSILNLYIMTGARSGVADASLGVGASFYALDALWRETATWVATGGMLTAATPMLALFLISGSTYAFTSLAGRLGGQDHFNEKMVTPDVAQPSALMSHSPHFTADRMSGVRVAGSDTSMAKVNIGSSLAANVSSKESALNAATDNLTAQVNEAISKGMSNQATQQLNRTIGESIASQKVNSNQTVRDLLRSSKEFSEKSASEQNEALGSLSTALSGNAGLSAGNKEVMKALGMKIGGGFGANVGANVGVTGTSTFSDKHSYGNQVGSEFGTQSSASHNRSLMAAMSRGREAAINSISSEQWSRMANMNEGTSIGKAFGKMASATSAYEEAVTASKSFGGQQSVSLMTLAEQLKGTQEGNWLANLERTAEGREANLAASAQKYSDLFGGDLMKGKIASALDYITNNTGSTALQAKLGDALAGAKLPMMNITPSDATENKGALKGPGNAEMFAGTAQGVINKAESGIDAQGWKLDRMDNQISRGGTSKGNDSRNIESRGRSWVEMSNLSDQAQIHRVASANSGAVMNGPQQEALHRLKQESRASALAEFANDANRYGWVDSLLMNCSDVPAPTAADSRDGNWILPNHQQTISGLSNAQTNYLEAYHYLNKNGEDEETIGRMDGASVGLENEMRSVLYPNIKKEDLSEEQEKRVREYTVAMADRIHHLLDFDNQAEANAITNFNQAFGIKGRL